MTTFALSWPPSVNSMYNPVAGRTIISKQYREWKEQAAAELLLQGVPGERQVGPRASLWIYVEPPDYRRRDLDNLIKPVQDAIVRAGFIEDDSIIDQLHIQRLGVAPGGRITFEIFRLPNYRLVTHPERKSAKDAPDSLGERAGRSRPFPAGSVRRRSFPTNRKASSSPP